MGVAARPRSQSEIIEGAILIFDRGLGDFCQNDEPLFDGRGQRLRVEVDVAKLPLLSLFRREENQDCDTCNSDIQHKY